MLPPGQFAHLVIALAVCILLWRLFARLRRNIGRQRLRLLRTQIAASALPAALLGLLVGAWAHPWNAAAQLTGVCLGMAAATFSFRTSKLEVVAELHYYTPNPYVGTAIVSVFVARVLYKLTLLYGATGGFSESPAALVRSPLTAFIAGLMLGFYAWQAWQLLRWHRATARATPLVGSA